METARTDAKEYRRQEEQGMHAFWFKYAFAWRWVGLLGFARHLPKVSEND